MPESGAVSGAPAQTVAWPDAITMLRQALGLVLATIRVAAVRDPFVRPDCDDSYPKHRFREALLGAARPPDNQHSAQEK